MNWQSWEHRPRRGVSLLHASESGQRSCDVVIALLVPVQETTSVMLPLLETASTLCRAALTQVQSTCFHSVHCTLLL